ncbi:DUF2442 domain-containing protein [Phocaeicola vulgatus]|uniref:DUF2442 domain-containing protein n=1 Tax=Phocaeicola vulgatus TaxID=821 RepID=UPI00216612A0|nr:DUF2442 domain-containing protein [Phocaeicola vulgatus]MCS3105557.1 DUF2442 domain-containing protein [Phocaeicola vulgatus]
MNEDIIKKVDKVWLTDTAICIRTSDGREASEQFADVQRLNRATPEQRSNYKVTPYGIYWPELDEDLSFEVFFSEKQNNVLYDLFIAHPELNASAIARRLGMSQSLFAQYISGTKKPSQERVNLILETIKNIGRELVSAQF